MKKFSNTLCYTCGEPVTFSEHIVSPTTGRMIPLDAIDLRTYSIAYNWKNDSA